jgi:hypothetical protein
MLLDHQWHNEFSRRLTTLTGGPQQRPHQRKYINHHNPAPCPSCFFSSPAFPHWSAPTNPPPHPQAPNPISLPTQAFSYSSWAVAAVVEVVVGYVALSAVVRCGEARTCLSSRAGTQSARQDLKTVRLNARRHAGSTLAWEFFGQFCC